MILGFYSSKKVEKPSFTIEIVSYSMIFPFKAPFIWENFGPWGWSDPTNPRINYPDILDCWLMDVNGEKKRTRTFSMDDFRIFLRIPKLWMSDESWCHNCRGSQIHFASLGSKPWCLGALGLFHFDPFWPILTAKWSPGQSPCTLAFNPNKCGMMCDVHLYDCRFWPITCNAWHTLLSLLPHKYGLR